MEFKSQYFDYKDMVRSDIADKYDIANIPTDAEIENANWLALKILDPLRAKQEFIISGWFRCKALNDKLGSKDTSAHRQGLAADLVSKNYHELFDFIINSKLPYDKVIKEKDKDGNEWVHISYSREPRKLKFTTKINKGVIEYVPLV